VNLVFRPARREDVMGIVALLRDDPLGATRESTDLAAYLAAFDEIAAMPGSVTIVGEAGGRVVATCQVTFIPGLAHKGARRAHVESVRVEAGLRRQGVGRALFAEVERLAREAGCAMIELTMNRARTESAAFYEALGFVPSHVGFKRTL